MKHIEIPIKINKDDVASLMQQILRIIIQRRTQTVELILPDLDKAFEDNNSDEILKHLQRYINVSAVESREIQYAAEMLNYIKKQDEKGSEVDTESSSKTEVLEDLPDLKEDGLGIDSGGE
jgi:hypothetical protein